MKKSFITSGLVLLIASIFFIHSCKKDDPVPPTVTTTAVTEISYTSAVSGGEVTAEGGGPVISRGVCWGTTANPTIDDTKTTESAGSGAFISNITDLTQNTMYYVRAYATNADGTGYGNQVSFTTTQIAVPELTTADISAITQTTARSGGNITDENGGSVSAKGVCWSTSENPTTSDSKTEDGTGTGAFVSSITELAAATTYYLRAYATNIVGTQYGDQISFTTEDPINIEDVEGTLYNVVRIGTQLWMKENLKTTKYSNGEPIGTTTPATLDLSGTIINSYQWAYDGDENNVATYGRLYTGYAVHDSRNVCPSGWHVPTNDEWTTLGDYLGGRIVAGGKLKEAGTTHWTSPNTGATNESGFSALPCGSRGPNGTFEGLALQTNMWSSTDFSDETGYIFGLGFGSSEFSNPYTFMKSYALSVRCLKDN
jgi:uncharacterized protein (TIGR02145 family)